MQLIVVEVGAHLLVEWVHDNHEGRLFVSFFTFL